MADSTNRLRCFRDTLITNFENCNLNIKNTYDQQTWTTDKLGEVG